jgi:hypothetical protein
MARWRLSPTHVARSVARGGHGRVESALQRLENHGYRVWNDLRIEAAVVDHVLVGPGGVFTVLCIRARRSADGTAAVWQATTEAMAVQRRLRQVRLRLPVQGLVVQTGSRRAGGPTELGIQKVSVIGPGELAGLVLGQGDRLTAGQLFVATDMLQNNRRVSWHPSIGR